MNKERIPRMILCALLFIYLLISYNGIWNIALYPVKGNPIGSLYDFINYCMMITPATGITASLGALSVLELVCTIQDSQWKTIMEMILWSLLTILINSYTAYLLSDATMIEIVWIVWAILFATTIINIYWYLTSIILLKQSEKIRKISEWVENDRQETEKIEEEKIATKDLLCKLLNEMDCNPEEIEDGRLKFEYQGVVFLAEANNDYLFVNFIWPWCHSVSIFDIDEFARVRKVVNELNQHGILSIFYTPSREVDEIGVHMKTHFILVPQMSRLNDYLRAILRNFFAIQRELEIGIEKERLQEVSTSS